MVSFIKVPPFEDTAKIFDAIVATGNNLINGPLKEKIFYIHIHKCGGTSIEQAMKACYHTLDITKQRQIYQLLNARASFNAVQKTVKHTNFPAEAKDDHLELRFRESLLLYYMYQEHINFIAGHFAFSETAYQCFSDKYALVTVLRNPVERWISLYYWNRYNQRGHRNISMDISEYLKSELGKARGHSYVKYLGGIDDEEDYTSEQAINRAKANLHKFSVVGCLEYQEDFLKQFEKRFARRLKIRVLNQSPKPKTHQGSNITEEMKEEIREICKPDIEIYQYALDNFVGRKD